MKRWTGQLPSIKDEAPETLSQDDQMALAEMALAVGPVVQVMDVGACEAIHGDEIENFQKEEAMRLSMHDDITAVDVEATTVSVTMEATTVSAAKPKRKRNIRSRREERRAARINKLPMI